jgi:hypothetical protein
MRAFRFFGVLAIGSLVALAACASDDAVQKPSATSSADVNEGAQRLAGDGFDASCCTRRDLDLNRDGRPDAYQFTRVTDGEGVVVRKEVDVNFDGKVDLVRNLDDKGKLLEERLDTDFDGKPDVWRYFDKGSIAREEADLNYDSRVDYWEYFEGGKLDRIGIDRDYDGNVDEWIRQTES